MAAFRSEDIERRLIDRLEDTEPRALLEQFAGLTRVSDSEDERRAADYLTVRLRAVGLNPPVHDARLFLSLAKRSDLQEVRAAVREALTFVGGVCA